MLTTCPSKGPQRMLKWASAKSTLLEGRQPSRPAMSLPQCVPMSQPPLLVPSRLSSTPGHRNGLLASTGPPRASRGCRRLLPAATSADPGRGPQDRGLGVRGRPRRVGRFGKIWLVFISGPKHFPPFNQGAEAGLLLLYPRPFGGLLIPVRCSWEVRGFSPVWYAPGRLGR